MLGKENQPKRRGRPPRPMPERIDASPEEIAETVLRRPPKKEWGYMKRKKGGKQ